MEQELLFRRLKWETYANHDSDQKATILELLKMLEMEIMQRYSTSRPLDSKQRQLLWNSVTYVRGHSRFRAIAPEALDGVLKAARAAPDYLFSKKQRKNLEDTRAKHAPETDYGQMYVMYDGPDDPDRYNGGGDFDTGEGYYCGS